MKKLLLTTMFVTAFLFYNETKAQVRFNLNVNIGARPAWGLAGSYAGDYYYLPEIDCYYDIPGRQFIYFDGYSWVYSYTLPAMYHDYDLYRGYKVAVNEYRPFMHADFYRDRYRANYNTYHAPIAMAPRNDYRFDNDRYARGRYEERNEARRDYGNNERYTRGNEHGGRERHGRG